MQHHKLLATSLLTLSLGACAADSDTMMMPEPQPATPTAFRLRIENIAPWTVLKSGVQATKTDGTTGALAHGQAYEVTFTAGKNQKVSFASMFGESNDWFFAPGPGGIALYDAQGTPVTGDVTDQISLWNAGTEIDQEPAVGDATGPNQGANGGPEYGAPDPDPTVRHLGSTVQLTDGSTFALPAISSMIKVTLTAGANRTFILRIENASSTSTLVTTAGSREIHISPAVWAVHNAPNPIFTPGATDRGQGLELVAESGRFPMLQSSLHALSGFATPISPGVYALHGNSEPLYSLGLVDRDQGLEHLAEDGNNMPLLDAMTGLAAAGGLEDTGSFDIPANATAKSAAKPGDAFELTVSGLPGDHLSFATMFGMSDDWVFATMPDGIALFDGDGMPAKGDVSDRIAIYDVGTEVDEELATGPDTGPQQPAANTGALDPIRQVREVPSSVYGLPASAHLRVTLTPE